MDIPITTISRQKPALMDSRQFRHQQLKILFHYIFHTLPDVSKLLGYWWQEASLCPDRELRKQALASIKTKAFHCQGGAVFAVPFGKWELLLLDLIVAYQTLCDYLDNLCDRANCTDGEAFRHLHQSLRDALTPGQRATNYYQYYPFKDDGGYIDRLVEWCQACVDRLPSYEAVYQDIMTLVDMYSQLQVNKHISPHSREDVLINWAQGLLPDYPGLLWQELAAASGSTLALFALLGLATHPEVGREESRSTVRTYFPWICGLHILLDYFIDQGEDREGGDLNFTFYYPDNNIMVERLKVFIAEAHRNAGRMPVPVFEETVIEGLLAMYLSDKKVDQLGFRPIARELIAESGGAALGTYRLCTMVRKFI